MKILLWAELLAMVLWTGSAVSRPLWQILIQNHPEKQRLPSELSGSHAGACIRHFGKTFPHRSIIYLCRWEIEKVFHQLKSKMEERKFWASSPEAKRAHGQFECLAHNLSLLSEQEMGELGLQDRVERKKDWGRSKTRRNREGKPMARASNFIGKAITRATQRTVRFIRWLRAHIYSEAPLSASLARLAKAWSC